MGVPQPEPLHGFSPNFQDMFTSRGSTADLVLVGIRLPLLPWQHFKDFRVLKFVGVRQTKAPAHDFTNFSPQEHLELIRFAGYTVTTVAMVTL